MTEKQKKLSPKRIKQENKKYDTTERIFFNDEEYFLDINPYFDPTKLQKMFADMGSFYQETLKEKIEIPDNLTTDIINVFVIKHFSTLTFPKPIKELANFVVELIRSEYYPQILDSYPIESVQAAFERFYATTEQVAKLQEMQEKLKVELENKVVNIENVLADKPSV